MTDNIEDGLDLAAVRERFLEAEERLRELAEAAVNLKTGSVQLKRARMGVVDASKVLEETTRTFAEFLIGVAEVNRRLSAVTAFAEEADPNALLRGIGELDSRLAEARSDLADRLAEVESGLAVADLASRDALGRGIASSAERIGTSIDALEAKLAGRIQAASEATAEAERSLGERMERVSAAALGAMAAEAAAARLERRRGRRLVWLAIALEVLVLGGVAYLLLRGPF